VSSRVVTSSDGELMLIHIKKKYRDYSGKLGGIYNMEYKKSFNHMFLIHLIN